MSFFLKISEFVQGIFEQVFRFVLRNFYSWIWENFFGRIESFRILKIHFFGVFVTEDFILGKRIVFENRFFVVL